jgi:hypothetical protein
MQQEVPIKHYSGTRKDDNWSLQQNVAIWKMNTLQKYTIVLFNETPEIWFLKT